MITYCRYNLYEINSLKCDGVSIVVLYVMYVFTNSYNNRRLTNNLQHWLVRITNIQYLSFIMKLLFVIFLY